MSDANPTYLSPSELGSKDYWETYYARTLAHISNETENPEEDDVNDEDDPGTSWFSEHNAPQKVLKFLTRKSFPLSPQNAKAEASILDLGTGNGSMLALLQKRGRFTGKMVGVDYSAQSIELARELQRSRGHSAYHSGSDDSSEDEEDSQLTGEKREVKDAAPIQFEEWDILSSTDMLSPTGCPSNVQNGLSWFPYENGGFDIVLDKGTFDAISLSGDAKETGVCERYPAIVKCLLRTGGFLVVTSCNWTEEELVKWFTAGEGDRFIVWGRVEYPRFRFGGQEGQGVCTVCFQRVSS